MKRSGTTICVFFLVFGLCRVVVPSVNAQEQGAWTAVKLANPREVEMRGLLGEALRRGIARLDMPPYTESWILADLSFELKRRYTNFSGDVTGRFLELASLTSPPGRKTPPTLSPVLAAITRLRNSRFQKPDGHFGVEIDLTKELVEDSPPLCLLWGNARLLVGLIACAEVYGDPQALAAAKRLGDFYVESSNQLCDPRREEEYHSSGTWGHSYTCDYFPAIEGLAMLFIATEDERYLKQAQRMAEFFKIFDALPNDHSHGNLSAWRGILLLHEITRDLEYLRRAREKWDRAFKGGYVWPIGGIGERWHVFYRAGETCSQADWLRFCLELWRFTGESRYLEVAERLLKNQYLVSQCETGGYGDLYFDGEPTVGPIAAIGILEADYCCCFAGPLGLHFLKRYLAVGSTQGIYVNFPMDFTSSVEVGDYRWRVAVRTMSDGLESDVIVDVVLAPEADGDNPNTTLWFRIPDWSPKVKRVSIASKEIKPVIENGYLRVDGTFRAGESVSIVLTQGLKMEGYRFQEMTPKPKEVQHFRDVSIFVGPRILCATLPKSSSGRVSIVANVNEMGRLYFPTQNIHGYESVLLLKSDIEESELEGAIQSAKTISLHPWSRIVPDHREVFSFDVTVVPDDSLSQESRKGNK